MSNAKPNASKHGPASTPTSPWVIFAAVAVPLVGIVLLGAALVGVYFAFREPARPAQEFARLDEKKGTPNVIPPGSKTPEKKADQPQTKKDSRTKDVDDDDRFSPDPVLSRTRKDDKDVVEQPKVTPGHAESPPKTKAPPTQAVIAPFIVDKEIAARVIKAGGKIGKVTVTLAWNNRNDLDLHVVTHTGEKIFYAHPRSRCGGQLDIDQNVSPTTTTPVENIYWPANAPPKGPIKIFVHHYRNHGLPDCKAPTRFVVRVQIDDEVRHFNGSVSFSSNRMAFVAEVPIGADGTVRWQK